MSPCASGVIAIHPRRGLAHFHVPFVDRSKHGCSFPQVMHEVEEPFLTIKACMIPSMGIHSVEFIFIMQVMLCCSTT